MKKANANEKKMIDFTNAIASKMSKDSSTKIGAVIADNSTIISMGYNGMPRGVRDDVVERTDRNFKAGNRPIKYSWFEHGERNAIYNVARNKSVFEGKSILTTGNIEMEDVRAIVSSGIKDVFIFVDNENGKIFPDDISEKITTEMFAESKVIPVIVNVSTAKNEDGEYDVEKVKDLISKEVIFKGISKIAKKFELLEQFKNIFAEDHEFKLASDEIFSVGKSAAIIFDCETYSDIAIDVSGIAQRLKEQSQEEDQSLFLTSYFMGGVRNVIYSALYPHLKGSTVYVNLCPCIDCSKAIASVGVKKVVYKQEEDPEVLARWKSSFDKTVNFLSLLKIDIAVA